jgi:hypothetical protein
VDGGGTSERGPPGSGSLEVDALLLVQQGQKHHTNVIMMEIKITTAAIIME